MSSTHENLLAKLEALLFIHGEPLLSKKIEKILGLDPEAVKNLLGELENRLAVSERGIHLASLGDKVQLVTKPEFGKLLEDFAKEELSEDLTPASLEALAIVTYLGPISRSRLEYLRGVNSIFILRSLRLRGLIERHEDPKNPNSYLYEPSFELIKHLGVKRKEDLAEYEKLRLLLEKAETETATTIPQQS
jgi:segregation and condensation protein B